MLAPTPARIVSWGQREAVRRCHPAGGHSEGSPPIVESDSDGREGEGCFTITEGITDREVVACIVGVLLSPYSKGSDGVAVRKFDFKEAD
jgi:hypothetical protein